MKQIFIALALGVIALLGQSAFADQIPGSQTRVANWSVGAYDSEGKFSHCAMSTAYNSGITMLYSVSGNYTWRVGWAHQSWNFSKDQSVDIVVFVDSAGPFYLKATAINKQLALAELPANGAVFDVMRKAYLMTVHAVGNTYKFNLDGTYAALTEIVNCASRYSGVAANRPPPAPMVPPNAAPMVPRTPAPSPSVETVTAEQRLEATKVVANILAQGEMTNFRILTAREVADLKIEYFSKSDVVWRAEGVIGTLRIIPKTPNVTAKDIATAVVADDLKNCKGQSVSGSTKDEKSVSVVRMFTGCQDAGNAFEYRYTVVPLQDGSHYLFATAAKTDTDEKNKEAAKAEVLLRQAVYEVLKR
jgi:hypothetical protein